MVGRLMPSEFRSAVAVNEKPQTWHYGLVAQWWAEFNEGGPEVAYGQRLIERYGQPALDAGCGTGRLLLPYLRAGLDMDGCDISSDMLAYCRQTAQSERIPIRLYEQAMHELDLPRLYKTILVFGAFELAGERHQSLAALKRLHHHLEPGGVLVLDHQIGDSANHWKDWLEDKGAGLPAPWPPRGEGRRASDGSVFFMRVRLFDFDPLEQVVTYQMRVELERDGKQIAEEQYTLNDRLYFKNELLTMLESAGFSDIEVQGDYKEEEATAEHGVLVFLARK